MKVQTESSKLTDNQKTSGKLTDRPFLSSHTTKTRLIYSQIVDKQPRD